jgi:hypothetical protein
MTKKTKGGEPRHARPMMAERAPPLLSEELITKLQAAVSAAHRKLDMRDRVSGETVSQETRETSRTAKDQ